MGFRFHRSKKLFPGVRLNFSKSGLGLSFGRRGMRFSIGPRGSRMTLGIPGTGLSYISQSGTGRTTRPLGSYFGGNELPETVYYKSGSFEMPITDSTYLDLIELAHKDIVSAVAIYNSAVGFLPEKEYRFFKETGEKYKPSEEQLGVENFLIRKWDEFNKAIYNQTHIDPVTYLVLSILLGWLSIHRFVVGEKTEGVCRVVLFIISFLFSWKPLMFLCGSISIIEGIVTLVGAEKDEKGNVVPFGIWDIILIYSGELGSDGRDK